jgi:hypothetical protein
VGNAGDARIALLDRLFDHAPLFPPASLPLPEAIAEDARAQASSAAFTLGRLVWPASRLGEAPVGDRRLSVVLDAPFEPDPRVEAVEAPPGSELTAVAGLAPEVYAEVPLDAQLDSALDRLGAHGVLAKVRCGGASPPTSRNLARFLRGCRERGLRFKATAGLHHAVRRDGEHGFLNLLAAVVFGDEEEALEETDVGAFTVARDHFSWRGGRAEADVVSQARGARLHSIGSCSFFEPIEELEALAVLPL